MCLGLACQPHRKRSSPGRGSCRAFSSLSGTRSSMGLSASLTVWFRTVRLKELTATSAMEAGKYPDVLISAGGCTTPWADPPSSPTTASTAEAKAIVATAALSCLRGIGRCVSA